MKFTDAQHKYFVERMLKRYGVAGNSEQLTTQEIVEQLLSKVNRLGIDKLKKFLSDNDFYTAPASTRFHGNYVGGLAEHSINVCALLGEENEKHNLCLSDESVILCGLMHDLCKVNFYKLSKRNKKNPDTKQWYEVDFWEVEDQLPMGHGEKSLYMLQGFLKVSREEAFMIRWHMGPFSSANEFDFNNAVAYQKSIAAMYVADFMASSLYEETIET